MEACVKVASCECKIALQPILLQLVLYCSTDFSAISPPGFPATAKTNSRGQMPNAKIKKTRSSTAASS
jgi:hypothetical protein